MFRMWFKLWENNHLLKDVTITSEEEGLNRTRRVLNSLEKACHTLDLAVPIWLDANIRDFQQHSRTRFTRDSFMEEVPFDYLEIQVLEE